jgi:ABC-2 type transport system permease protein
MNTTLMITRIEFKLFMRNFAGVFFVLAFPILLLLFFGSMFGNAPVQFYGGHGTMDVDVPVFSCVVITITGILVIPWTVTRYRENKILKRYMATPIKPRNILTSQLVVNLVMAAVSITVLVLFGKFTYGVLIPHNILPVVLALFILALCIFSMGLLITSISSGIRASNVISLLVYFPMLFLSGAIMPLDTMPENMARIGRVLPLSYGIDLIKGVWFGGSLSAYSTDIFVLLLVFLVCTAGSIILFKWE